MSAKKQKLFVEGRFLESPTCSPCSRGDRAVLPNNPKQDDDEPLSFVQTLRKRMDEMERESAERHKALSALPHMKRFKTNLKRRQIRNMLQKMSESEDGEKKYQLNRKRKRMSKFLVMTGIEKSTRETVFSVVNKLGDYEIQAEVDFKTTHVVSAGKRRTVNILKAILSGCWVLSVEWVWKSLEKGFWVEEEQYELVDDFPSAKLIRQERLASQSRYQSTLLASIGPIFVSPNTNPPPRDIVQLIKLSGGCVSGSARRAALCIGQTSSKSEAIQVSETWLLDCITQQISLALDDYLIGTA